MNEFYVLNECVLYFEYNVLCRLGKLYFIFSLIVFHILNEYCFDFPTDNGFLTIETLKGILLELEPNLPDEDLAQIVEEVDEDGSGTIDFDGKIVPTESYLSKPHIYCLN